MELKTDSFGTAFIRNMYASLAIWRVIEQDYATYFMIGDSEEGVRESLNKHYKDVMEDAPADEDISVEICHPNDAITINYEGASIALKAREWAAIFCSNGAEWDILACTEWD